MDCFLTLCGSWDVAADLSFQPSVPSLCLGKGREIIGREWRGLDFVCGCRAGREAIGAILTLWGKFDRSDVLVGGFKGLEITRQLRQLLVVLHDTGSQQLKPAKDTLHQVSGFCREVLRMDSLDNHAYAKIMDNFMVIKYGLMHGRAMSPCNPQGIRFWYTIAGEDSIGVPGDDSSEDSWKVGADCPVLESMTLDVDLASSGTSTAGSLPPNDDVVPDQAWGAPYSTGFTFCGVADWVEEPGSFQKDADFSVEKECAMETQGCWCGFLGVFKKLFMRLKKGKK